MPCGTTLCKLVFSGVTAAWEQRHTRKAIRLKIYPNLLFYQFIGKLFASRSTLCHLLMTQRSWEKLDYIIFRSTFAVSIEVSKFSRAKNFQGYVVLFVSNYTQQVSIFRDSFCSFSATPINEVRLEPLSPSCRNGASRTSQLALPHGFRFCYTHSRSVETWGNSIIFLYQFCNFPILLNLMRKTGFKRAKEGQKKAQNWHKSVNFLHQIQQNWKEMDTR